MDVSDFMQAEESRLSFRIAIATIADTCKTAAMCELCSVRDICEGAHFEEPPAEWVSGIDYELRN